MQRPVSAGEQRRSAEVVAVRCGVVETPAGQSAPALPVAHKGPTAQRTVTAGSSAPAPAVVVHSAEGNGGVGRTKSRTAMVLAGGGAAVVAVKVD